jgi:hypothetical protein
MVTTAFNLRFTAISAPSLLPKTDIPIQEVVPFNPEAAMIACDLVAQTRPPRASLWETAHTLRS